MRHDEVQGNSNTSDNLWTPRLLLTSSASSCLHEDFLRREGPQGATVCTYLLQLGQLVKGKSCQHLW